MTNPLFNPKFRSKVKKFRHNFLFWNYYEDEDYSLKEKFYTLHYNLERTGRTAKGEMEWSLRMIAIDKEGWIKLEDQFYVDYKEFINR
jgi:hypothetical protein